MSIKSRKSYTWRSFIAAALAFGTVFIAAPKGAQAGSGGAYRNIPDITTSTPAASNPLLFPPFFFSPAVAPTPAVPVAIQPQAPKPFAAHNPVVVHKPAVKPYADNHNIIPFPKPRPAQTAATPDAKSAPVARIVTSYTDRRGFIPVPASRPAPVAQTAQTQPSAQNIRAAQARSAAHPASQQAAKAIQDSKAAMQRAKLATLGNTITTVKPNTAGQSRPSSPESTHFDGFGNIIGGTLIQVSGKALHVLPVLNKPLAVADNFNSDVWGLSASLPLDGKKGELYFTFGAYNNSYSDSGFKFKHVTGYAGLTWLPFHFTAFDTLKVRTGVTAGAQYGYTFQESPYGKRFIATSTTLFSLTEHAADKLLGHSRSDRPSVKNPDWGRSFSAAFENCVRDCSIGLNVAPGAGIPVARGSSQILPARYGTAIAAEATLVIPLSVFGLQ